MWGIGRNETDVDRIKKAVERKKLLAAEAGLDRLFLDVYHGSIRHWPFWAKSERDKRFVYPEAAAVAERVVKSASGDTFITEFSLGGKKYKTMSARRGNIVARDLYYVIELFLEEKKIFAVSEKHDASLKGPHYYTLNIDAYAGDDWVDDFRRIREYQKKMDKEAAAEQPEDKELAERLKKDFNLDNYNDRVIRIRAWPRYKVWRLFLLLIILILVFFTFLEFQALVNR